jgi:hypothetical protein
MVSIALLLSIAGKGSDTPTGWIYSLEPGAFARGASSQLRAVGTAIRVWYTETACTQESRPQT